MRGSCSRWAVGFMAAAGVAGFAACASQVARQEAGRPEVVAEDGRREAAPAPAPAGGAIRAEGEVGDRIATAPRAAAPAPDPVLAREKPLEAASAAPAPVPQEAVQAPAPPPARSPAPAASYAAKAAGVAGLPPGEPGKPSYAGFGETWDEVWVIQRPPRQVAPEPGDAVPGSGELRAAVPDQAAPVPFPLRHTDVAAAIQGYIASVRVTQQYENPYGSKIEAVYVFPLPENAAVSDFVMVIGERKIRGIIREREEAVRVYTEARNQGYVASLLTQERPNVFTQKVANIEPGKRIDVEITYFHTLAYADGEYSFVFPMVVGPRYNPAGTTDGVGAVARGSAGASGQKTEVPYLKPGERSGHDILVAVDLDAGVSLEEVASTTHAVAVERPSPTRARVRLKPADTLPNKDFVLRYRVAGKAVKAGFVAERDGEGGTFTLVLHPPAGLGDLKRSGLELVFVIDTSGSMNGWPIDKARQAIRRALQNLDPGDTFQVVRFANGFGTFAPLPVAATPENVASGLAYLEGLGAGGGTEMLQGLRGALDFPHDPRRLRVVGFFTDGYVGNEAQILAAVAEKLGPARIFSFGVGSSVNRYLMEGLARVGRGAVAYLTTHDSGVEAVDRFFATIAHPALTDVEIDWGGLRVSEVYPQRVPDLFVGRAVTLVGRFAGTPGGQVRVRGRAAGEQREYAVAVDAAAAGAEQRGIGKIWARAKIADLSDRLVTTGDAGLRHEIQETALAHGLLSDYTAFVAVDSTRRTEGTSGTTVAVPVPVPEGVRYETTVIQ